MYSELILSTGVIYMKDQRNKKVPLPMKVRQSTFDELDQTAKKMGIPRSDVAAYRIEHYPIPLTPELMMELQNDANKKYEELKPNMPEEAIKIQKKVMELWKLLK